MNQTGGQTAWRPALAGPRALAAFSSWSCAPRPSSNASSNTNARRQISADGREREDPGTRSPVICCLSAVAIAAGDCASMFVQARHPGPGPTGPESVGNCLKGGHRGTNHSSAAFPQVERQFSAPGRIRTRDRLLRRQLLCPAELRAPGDIVPGEDHASATPGSQCVASPPAAVPYLGTGSLSPADQDVRPRNLTLRPRGRSGTDLSVRKPQAAGSGQRVSAPPASPL